MTETYPLKKYALNLEDLENVEGWNEKANKDDIFGFKLNERGIYERCLIKEKEEQADIDFQLLPDKFILSKYNKPDKLLNSGKMLVTLDLVFLTLQIKRKFNKYYLTHHNGSTSPLTYSIKSMIEYDQINLKEEFPKFKMIIEGYSINRSESEIIKGIKVQLEREEHFKVKISSTEEVPIYDPHKYKRIIKVENNKHENFIPIEFVNLNEITVTPDYLISRIQFFIF